MYGIAGQKLVHAVVYFTREYLFIGSFESMKLHVDKCEWA